MPNTHNNKSEKSIADYSSVFTVKLEPVEHRGQCSTGKLRPNAIIIRLSKYGDKGLFVANQVQDASVTMLVDTGANVTVLRKDIADKFPQISHSVGVRRTPQFSLCEEVRCQETGNLTTRWIWMEMQSDKNIVVSSSVRHQNCIFLDGNQFVMVNRLTGVTGPEDKHQMQEFQAEMDSKVVPKLLPRTEMVPSKTAGAKRPMDQEEMVMTAPKRANHETAPMTSPVGRV
ncbi:hypothetical protein CHS0354_014805 [Potamilus streckersoni]|uniref:Peptidase A2 domain-containing protein n=1 Tax=Potamilus streckersoni TaxID=2493646 RepID=A0AAE0RVA1_9BIVA|nr:hypothetical protein CHS0354_014805 [Potamilus streckersoni]